MKKILLLASVLLSLSVFAQNDDGTILKKNDRLPEFRLESSIHGTIDSKDLQGKITLITIFATWCGPCQRELAEIQKELWPQYKDNPDFVMLVAGREHTDDELTKYNEKKKFTFPLYPDPKREFTGKFATKNIPRTYLVDKEGKIIYTSIGYSEKEFKALIKLLKTKLKK